MIGSAVETASLDEGSALTIELANGVVLGLSLREEDLDGPDSGLFSPTSETSDVQEF